MANVHVRDIPEDVHAALKGRAAAEGRSLNELIVRSLGQTAARPTPAEFVARIRARKSGVSLTSADFDAALREARPTR